MWPQAGSLSPLLKRPVGHSGNFSASGASAQNAPRCVNWSIMYRYLVALFSNLSVCLVQTKIFCQMVACGQKKNP